MTLIVVNQHPHSPDTYDVLGVDQPLGTLVKKETVNHYGERENEVILTLKVPGHSYWSGIGTGHGYAPAEYQVYRVLWEKRKSPTELHIKTKQLTAFPVRTPKGA